jgi:hypothetical protein
MEPRLLASYRLSPGLIPPILQERNPATDEEGAASIKVPKNAEPDW